MQNAADWLQATGRLKGTQADDLYRAAGLAPNTAWEWTDPTGLGTGGAWTLTGDARSALQGLQANDGATQPGWMRPMSFTNGAGQQVATGMNDVSPTTGLARFSEIAAPMLIAYASGNLAGNALGIGGGYGGSGGNGLEAVGDAGGAGAPTTSSGFGGVGTDAGVNLTGAAQGAGNGGLLGQIGSTVGDAAQWMKDNPLMGKLLMAGGTTALSMLGNRNTGPKPVSSTAGGPPKQWTLPTTVPQLTQQPVTQMPQPVTGAPRGLIGQGNANTGAWRYLLGG